MMHRNLDRRVEVLVQVKDPELTAQIDWMFDSAMDPATRCWDLDEAGVWHAGPSGQDKARDHQRSLIDHYRKLTD
jgi:polyphosphate kinase